MLDDLKELLRQEPFVPFRIVLTSGTSYDVSSSYQVAIGKTEFMYCYPASDRKAYLRQNQVAAFETFEPTQR